jgi:hypothetical protein
MSFGEIMLLTLRRGGSINLHPMCCNPSLGVATKARACKKEGQDGVWESVRMNIHTPK